MQAQQHRVEVCLLAMATATGTQTCYQPCKMSGHVCVVYASMEYQREAVAQDYMVCHVGLSTKHKWKHSTGLSLHPEMAAAIELIQAVHWSLRHEGHVCAA